MQTSGIFHGKKKYRKTLKLFFKKCLFSYKQHNILLIENINRLGSEESRSSYKYRIPLRDDRAKQLRYTINLEYFAYLFNRFVYTISAAAVPHLKKTGDKH